MAASRRASLSVAFSPSLRGFVASWLLLLVPVCAQQIPATQAAADTASADDPEFREPVSAAMAAQIDDLIQALASPRYTERTGAESELLQLGVSPFPKLRAAYHKTHDFEVRYRIQSIVHAGYLELHVFGGFGFLGISQRPLTQGDVSLIPEDQAGIGITRIIPDSGAERAGLLAEDVILAIDGEPIRGFGGAAVSWVGKQIRDRGPGTTMELRVLRDNAEVLTIFATLTRPPGQVRNDERGSLPYVDVLTARAKANFPAWWLKHFGPVENES